MTPGRLDRARLERGRARLWRGWKAWTDVHPFLVGLLVFLLLAAFNESRGFTLWRNYALSGILLGLPATYAIHRADVRLPAYIQWTIVGALLSHYVGGSLGSPDPYRMGLLGMHGVNGTYHHFDWWDHLTHGVGIGASAMGIAYLVEVYQTRRGLGWGSTAVWVVAVLAALTAGVGVELYEYLGKTAFQTIDQGGYENTMRDLHFNLVGAMVGAGLATTVNRARFQGAILQRWPPARVLGPEAPWWQRVPPGMAGFITFVSIPAAAALYLATEFFSKAIPPDDVPLYDPALQVLVAAAASAIATGPTATWILRAWRRQGRAVGGAAEPVPDMEDP